MPPLAGRGLLDGRWQEPDRPGRPPRHAYRLSAAGRAALREAAQAPAKLVLKEAFR